MNKENNKWQNVWTRKGTENNSLDLQGLMKADGFDTGTGAISIEDWMKTSQKIIENLQISNHSKVLEVGCGAGAMLWPLRDTGAQLYGVDYSETLLCKAKQANPDIKTVACEASALDLPSNMFDAVFSHGVFFYFHDYEYAEKTMNEILRVLNGTGKMFILDIPDLAKRDDCEKYRRDVVYKGGDYPTAEDGPYRHLYYSKSWFKDFGKKHDMRVTTSDQNLPSYPMAPYRFNALLEY